MESFRYFVPILKQPEYRRHILVELSSIKFHEFPFRGRRVVPCGQRNKLTIPILASRKFAIAHKSYTEHVQHVMNTVINVGFRFSILKNSFSQTKPRNEK
jgi:hypothetical protein